MRLSSRIAGFRQHEHPQAPFPETSLMQQGTKAPEGAAAGAGGAAMAATSRTGWRAVRWPGLSFTAGPIMAALAGVGVGCGGGSRAPLVWGIPEYGDRGTNQIKAASCSSGAHNLHANPSVPKEVSFECTVPRTNSSTGRGTLNTEKPYTPRHGGLVSNHQPSGDRRDEYARLRNPSASSPGNRPWAAASTRTSTTSRSQAVGRPVERLRTRRRQLVGKP